MCPPEEARTLACDLLLQDFICLAIVNPERYGVTGDLPIPDKARINLMQIAQQLQRKGTGSMCVINVVLYLK